jgi:hypothetical protein
MIKKKERLYLFDYNFQNIYLFCVLLTMFFVAITGVIYLGCGFEFIGDFEALADAIVGSGFLKFFILMWVWMVLHEIIHGVSYILYGAKAKDIKYGVALEKGILYCKCGEYVDKTNICWSILNPFIYIGIVTLFLGFAFESVMLVALSIVNISGACADIAVWGFFVGRNKDMKFKEIKDSSTFILKTTEDLTNKKFFAVKLVEELEKDNFKENDKIITITKGSKVILGFMAVIVILYIILGLI